MEAHVSARLAVAARIRADSTRDGEREAAPAVWAPEFRNDSILPCNKA
jgi:hypothetical protein